MQHPLLKPLRLAGLGIALLLAALLWGCSGKAPPPRLPVNIHKGDRCAVCGMYIQHFPGPRGEAYLQGRKDPLKFGSTRDFFAYVTRADVQHKLGAVYVQDSAHILWRRPSNAASTFVDARKAWYVGFQPLKGAMGPTLASFARRDDAQAFIRIHGGALLRYADVTPELVSKLAFQCPRKGSSAAALVSNCQPPGQAAPASTSAASPGL